MNTTLMKLKMVTYDFLALFQLDTDLFLGDTVIAQVC